MALEIDIAPHLAAFGERLTLAGAPVCAIFDTEAVDPLGNVITAEPSVLLKAADAPSAAVGQTVVRRTTAGSVSYAVRQVLQEPPDGALLRLVLARA